jgi:hypothetical protein
MSSNNQTVFLVLLGVGAGIGLWLLLKEDRRRRERFNGPLMRGFERDFLTNSDTGQGRYWRSDANFVADQRLNPHYIANPHSSTLPLEMMNDALGLQLIPQYVPNPTASQYGPGPNDYTESLPDDLATRRSLFANGNMPFNDWLNSAREDGVISSDYQTKFSISQSML